MRRLDGRVAVVTGAASGIGRALAGRFAAEGMRCVLADIETDALEHAVQDLHSSGAEAIGVRTDVAVCAERHLGMGARRQPLGRDPRLMTSPSGARRSVRVEKRRQRQLAAPDPDYKIGKLLPGER
ncbi:hypothetical protein Acsp03_53620 [Actinomadura sp. NBRC 104412]|uniref:SDR family NAD(P)-dependent oxidoreductase n=1 Tax=Actinomadura sp. NBRC 104412 TaxID=3032203 RepID=UPI0024A00341|nr:SDR family NAD(P)-dependent oxidoreductase [Actinomadura sp. NBRC 104412]GLZ07896.1 hypothetical protein Acsp03_53620 [Actinomadura sp. NBRC 104412]